MVIPDLRGDEELCRFGSAVDAAVTARRVRNARALERSNRCERTSVGCQNLWEDCEEVRPLTFHLRIGEAASTLLGVDALRIWQDKAVYKRAGAHGTGPHADHNRWPIEEMRTITAWIPFDGSNFENGAMGYQPGSHHFEQLSFASTLNETGFESHSNKISRDIDPVFVEVPRGGVAFYHGRTIHAARPNTSCETSRVHSMTYFAYGSHRSQTQQPHPSVDRPGIPPGALIESDLTPIAWPRIPGKLPHPPRLSGEARR